jgi:hypothetical protein
MTTAPAQTTEQAEQAAQQSIVIVGLIPDGLTDEQAEAIMLAGSRALEEAGAAIQVAVANVSEFSDGQFSWYHLDKVAKG